MTWTPPPGAIGLTYAYGAAAARAALGRTLAVENRYSHAFVVLGDQEVMEPWPSGARINSLEEYADTDVTLGYITGLIRDEQLALASAALSLDGIGYGFGDHWALALHRCRWGGEKNRSRLAAPRRLLPAQFVAETYRRCGVDLMPHRAHGDITVADIAHLMMSSNAWELRAYGQDPRPRRRHAR